MSLKNVCIYAALIVKIIQNLSHLTYIDDINVTFSRWNFEIRDVIVVFLYNISKEKLRIYTYISETFSIEK